MSAPANGVDLAKMTVPSLKIMCKNRGLSGYSKMKKEVLMALLKTSLAGPAGNTSVEAGSVIASSAAPSLTAGRPVQPQPVPAVASSSTPSFPSTSTSSSPPQAHGKRQRSPEGRQEDVGPIMKKAALTIPPAENLVPTSLGIKATAASTIAPTHVVHSVASTSNGGVHTSQPPARAHISSPVRLPTRPPTRHLHGSPGVKPALAPRRVGQMIALVHKPTKPKVSVTTSIIPSPSPSTAKQESSLPIAARRIIPSGADTDPGRKHIRMLAIVLSVLPLSNADRYTCALVSRGWRHAVFLSAQPILEAQFAGARLSRYLLDQYIDPYLLDVWPYLRARERELSGVRTAYASSFLRRFHVSSAPPLADKLWSNPDHEDQVRVALRFVAFRLAVSISQHAVARWSKWQVYGVTALGNGNVYEIVTKYKQHTKKLLVLAASGEVIEQLAGSAMPGTDSSVDIGPSIRPDWSAFVTSRLQPVASTDSPQPSLAEYVRCQNEEEFEGGISKVWLREMKDKADSHRHVKVTVAKRYIIANAVPNSVSGKYKTPLQMAQSLDGPEDSTPHGKLGVEKKVNLFVAPCNYVESLHFDNKQKLPFHPAVASAQTQAREVFLLRETGQEIGSEEEGIRPVWMTLLGCSAGGVPCANA